MFFCGSSISELLGCAVVSRLVLDHSLHAGKQQACSLPISKHQCGGKAYLLACQSLANKQVAPNRRITKIFCLIAVSYDSDIVLKQLIFQKVHLEVLMQGLFKFFSSIGIGNWKLAIAYSLSKLLCLTH